MVATAEPAPMGITVYERINDPIQAMTVYGDDIAKSGLLGCSNVSQGRLIAMECFARRTTAMTIAQQFHIIDNKLSMKADAMLAELRRLGGKHKVVKRSADHAEIEITFDGDTQRFVFTWEEAKQEPFVYDAKRKDALAAIARGDASKLTLNPNYASPRKRMQMLWARVVSDGVRTMAPEVNFGRYVPEEIEDEEDGPAANSSQANGHAANGNGKAKVSVDSYTPPTTGTATATSNTVDAEFEPKAEPKPESKIDPKASGDEHAKALATLQEAIEATGNADTTAKICERFGVGALRSLTLEQLATTRLELKIAAENAANRGDAAEPPKDAESTEPAPPDAPCTEVQKQECGKLLKALIPTYQNLGTLLTSELEKIKLKKAGELNLTGMNYLLTDLQRGDGNLTQFKLFVQGCPF